MVQARLQLKQQKNDYKLQFNINNKNNNIFS